MNRLVLGTAILLLAAAHPILTAAPTTLPQSVSDRMKGAKDLTGLWILPAFDRAQGFAIGAVSGAGVDSRWSPAVHYLPTAFARIALPGSTNTLALTGVSFSSLTTDKRSTEYFPSATVQIEGLVTAPDGSPLVAFAGREKCSTQESAVANAELAIDKIVAALAKNLGGAFQRALAARQDVAEQPTATLASPGYRPPAPAAQPESLDIPGRLFQLESLRKQGIISAEEYEAHKAKILAGH